MINRIDLIISIIDEIQENAKEEYEEKFRNNRLPIPDTANIDPEALLVFGAMSGVILQETPAMDNLYHLGIYFVLPYLTIKFASNLYAYSVTPDILMRRNNIMITKNHIEGLANYLQSEVQQEAFNFLLDRLNINWNIKLGDFKRLLTEIKQQKSTSSGFFDTKLETILFKYRPHQGVDQQVRYAV